jgi:hypothetical protein
MRHFQFDIEEHKTRVEKSPNGLVSYSEIHRCSDGLLNIYDLQIDNNHAIRSFSQMKLPTHRRPSALAVPGVPSPRLKTDEKRINFNIDKMLPEHGFRLVIYDDMINVSINIGEVDVKNELLISRLESDHGTIRLDYYFSDIQYTTNIEKLLAILVNTLEIVPPTKIGLFVETLRYIHGIHKDTPTSFHIKLLKTILTTHETHFILEEIENTQEAISDLKYKYSEEVGGFASELLERIESDLFAPLQKYMTMKSEHHKNDDLIFLIHTLMLMEQTGLLIIDRPGIVEET